jgi:hypothetical protein
MRRFMLFSSIAILFAAAPSRTPLLAQFQDPVKDELQMTSDSNAPGAAAIFLYREDVTDEASHTHSLYERIKVLTEKGKELATVKTSYDPASERVEIDARTIHADGTIVPMVDKPSDIVDYKSKGFQLNTQVFTLPSVEVGSILEYRITTHSPFLGEAFTWTIQQSYFVRKAHYSYKAVGALLPSYGAQIGPDAKVVNDHHGLYTLDINNIPALPDDDWMPPLNTVKWRVWFFRTFYPTPQAFWDQSERSWTAFVNDFTKSTGTLKKAVSGMVESADSPAQKTQKIYAAVMKLENTDYTRRKSFAERKKEKIKDIHNAQDVWREQGGSADQIALLFVALCRAEGLEVDPMIVTDRSRTVFDFGYLSGRQLQDYIAVAHLDGKDVYLDPGQKMCPFGMLAWPHTLTSGFRPSANSATIARTPAGGRSSSSVERLADLTIDETGNVEGSIRVVMGGQDALRWRQVAILSDESEVKKLFNEWMKRTLPEGINSDFDHFLALDDYESNLMGIVHVTGTLGANTGKRMFLPGLFFQSKARHPFVEQEKRTIAVDVQFATFESDEVTYRFPAGFKVESSPQASSLDWPDHAKLAISTSLEPGVVVVSRTLTCSYVIVDPKDYASLHGFYQKLAAADQQQVVLARAPQAKEN